MNASLIIDENPRTKKFDYAVWVEGLGTVKAELGFSSFLQARDNAVEWWNEQLAGA